MLLVAGIAAIGIAGVAFAQGVGASGVTLCIAKKGGVRLADDSGCRKSSRSVTVAQQGPEGEAGPQGPAGAPGADGTPILSLEPEAVRNVGAFAGGCGANPGTFCGDQAGLSYWTSTSDDRRVGYRIDAAGWVHLSGGARQLGGNGANQIDDPSTIFYLPAGYRPTDGTHRFYVPRGTCVNPSTSLSYVDVTPSGAVKPEFTSPAQCLLSLESVEFHP
jgi:hypothetical protein